jgi:hypothetical protein
MMNLYRVYAYVNAETLDEAIEALGGDPYGYELDGELLAEDTELDPDLLEDA